MQGFVEMARLQEVGDTVEGIVVDKDRTEQRLLGLDVVRCLAIERLLRHAEFSRWLCHDIPDFDPRSSISEWEKSVLTYLQQSLPNQL